MRRMHEVSGRSASITLEPWEANVTSNPIERPKRGGFIISAAAAVIMIWATLAFAGLSDPAYQEGFGKDATGGAGKPTYHITSSAATGAGSFSSAIYAQWNGQNLIHDVNVVFDVDTFTTSQTTYIGSNVTIDGCANGRNGVIFDHGGVGDVNGAPSQPPAKRGIVLSDGSNNVIIRCINFIGYGWPSIEKTDPTHAQPEYNFIWLAGGSYANGGTISNVLIDRCTFTRTTNKAFDVTNGGNFTSTTTNVTFQRNLIHDNSLASHVKYADGVTTVRQNISYHHNVFVHGGERQPQIVDKIGPVDYVNNIVYTNSGDVPAYPDGGQVDAYGVRVWNTSAAGQALRLAASADTFHGDVTVNVVANAFLGDRANIVIFTDTSIPGDPSPASNAGNYVSADNYFNPSTNAPLLFNMGGASSTGATTFTPSLPWNVPNAIPLAYQVTTLTVNQLAAAMLPYVGAPNRTALDQQRINEAAAQLPGSAGLPQAPSNLTVY
jgi:hypothetical protein